MLSRVANSVYWMSRYIERAENVARFIEVNLNLNLDSPIVFEDQWKPLVKTSGDMELFESKYKVFNKENVTNFLTFDMDNPNSILSCLISARENSRSIREIISSEMWQQLNSFYLYVSNEGSKDIAFDDPYSFYSNIVTNSHLFTGVTDSTISHSEGWHFIRMGRLIERADKTSRILDVKYYILLPSVKDVGTPIDFISWSALLKSASGYEMYRKKYRRILPNSVAEFLLLDPDFPRSILYCLNIALLSMRAITGSSSETFSNEAEKLMGRLCSELNYTNIEEIIDTGLHEFLDDLQIKLNSIGDKIFKTYFDVQPMPVIDNYRGEE